MSSRSRTSGANLSPLLHKKRVRRGLSARILTRTVRADFDANCPRGFRATMRVCPACHTRTMIRFIRPESVAFMCPCGAEVPGGSAARLIAGGESAEVAHAEKYKNVIRNAPHSRVGLRVERECSKCDLPYMTMIRVGEEQAIIYACKCGHQEAGGKKK